MASSAAQSRLANATSGPPLQLVAAASSTTGALAWVSSFPFDSVKSVQQAQPAGRVPRCSPTAAAAQLWRQGGAAAFYRGVSASTFRAVLVTGSRLWTFEAARGWLRT